ITSAVCQRWSSSRSRKGSVRCWRCYAPFRQVGSPYILPPGTPGEQVKILREALAKTFKDAGFHQEYKKLSGDEATPLMADEMEKAVKGLPRDREIVELFKKIASGDPLPPR